MWPLQQEELLVFPYIKRLAHSQEEGIAAKPPPGKSLKELLDTLEAEHDATGDTLAQLARLSGGYTPPADACPTYRTLYTLLGQFDAATKKHSPPGEQHSLPQGDPAGRGAAEDRLSHAGGAVGPERPSSPWQWPAQGGAPPGGDAQRR